MIKGSTTWSNVLTNRLGGNFGLAPALIRPIRWELVTQQHDQMIRYTTAIRTGTASTKAILRRFTRSASHPAYRAMPGRNRPGGEDHLRRPLCGINHCQVPQVSGLHLELVLGDLAGVDGCAPCNRRGGGNRGPGLPHLRRGGSAAPTS